MEGHEGAPFVAFREVVGVIEGGLKGRGGRLRQHIRKAGLVLEVGACALVAGILVSPDVVPGPAVECALLDLGGVFERGVVAELVTLVDDAPWTAGRRLNRETGAVAQAGGEDLLVLAVRIE